MAQRDCQWFLVPKDVDPYTNECIARELAATGDASGNEIIFIDNKGKERRGWRVEYKILNAFVRAAEVDGRIKVIPFVREGEGQYREYKLIAKRKPSKKESDAVKKLNELKMKKKGMRNAGQL
jgi:hypothetical protein